MIATMILVEAVMTTVILVEVVMTIGNNKLVERNERLSQQYKQMQ